MKGEVGTALVEAPPRSESLLLEVGIGLGLISAGDEAVPRAGSFGTFGGTSGAADGGGSSIEGGGLAGIGGGFDVRSCCREGGLKSKLSAECEGESGGGSL